MNPLPLKSNTAGAPDVSAIILCGGRGSRMDGRDKGLVEYRDKPLVQWVIERIRPQVGQIVLSANRNLGIYRSLSFPALPDRDDDFAGPLSGVSTAFAEATGRYILVLPCDTPDLPLDLASRLANAAGAGGAYASDPERDHPIVHLFHRDRITALNRYLDRGGASVKGWLADIGAVRVLFEDARRFKNMNSASDLES